jgi:hypothetical protein
MITVMVNKQMQLKRLIKMNMKNINNISKLAFIAVIGFVALFSSCKGEDDLVMPRLFRPVNFNAELNKTVATISWAAVDSAVSYTLQISTDSLNFATPVLDTTITELSFVKELAGETKFYARLYANSNDSTKQSKYNVLSFKTPAENIFQGFGTSVNTGKLYSAYMTDVNILTVKWAPGANVTHLILTSADGGTRDSVLISASEAVAGQKDVPSLTNSNWYIKIYNNKIQRGKTYGLIEGDVILSSTDDLPTALNNATAGQVILLAKDGVYKMGSAVYRLAKNVKVRGVSPIGRPVLCMTAGTPTSTSNMLGFADASTIDFVKFENIDFTGFCDNTVTSTKIGYLFNNNLLTNVKSLSFTNCNLHNFGNTPMRLQGAKSQVIDTLSFNGCVVNDIGFSSTYAIVNSNSTDYINNIYMSNCSFFNFKGSLILRTATSPVVATMGNINITNCTINQGMQDAGSARYLIDANGTTVTNGISFKNCIFGSAGGALGANGVRKGTATVTVTGSYFTTDYIDDPVTVVTSYSIKSLMTAYSGASTALWNNPATGDFTLKASSFAGKGLAGDLRWY